MPFRLPLTFLLLAGIFFGLVFSPPVLSIGLIGLMILLVLDPREGLNPRWRERAPAWFRRPFFWAMISLYAILLLGGWQTEDWPYYLERLQIKLPLLLLPFAWPGLPDFTSRQRDWVIGGFAVFLLLVLLGVLGNYALNFAEINAAISRGQSVPVPRNHIRFSLLVAIATFAALSRGRRFFVVAALLFVGQHFLAVRSGLAGAYLGGAVYLLVYTLEHKKYQTLYIGLGGLLLLPLLAYATVPSFRAKFDYARYELFHRPADAADGGRYSDSERFRSMGVGMDIWRAHPLLGVGPGNLRAETDRRYRADFGLEKGHRPHNQFVSALAGSGLPGYFVTLWAFLLLGFAGGRWRQPVFLAVWSVLFVSCLVENTLETSAGVSLFCVFLLLFDRTD